VSKHLCFNISSLEINPGITFRAHRVHVVNVFTTTEHIPLPSLISCPRHLHRFFKDPF